MNLYTATYEATQPVPKAISVPLDSKYALGVKLTLEGKTITPKPGELLLNGNIADGTLNDYAVFNLSSDSTEGREVYEVVTAQPGVASKELSTYVEVPRAGSKTPISADISDWEGVTIYCDDQPKLSGPDYSMMPFNIYKVKTADGTSVFASTAIYFYVDGVEVVRCVNATAPGGGDIQEFWKYEGSTLVKSNSFTIPANCTVYGNPTTQSSYGKVYIDAYYVETFEGNYDLFIDKKDVGKAEGYLDVYSVYPYTINLSGTNEDDSTFDYDLPVKEK